MDVDDMPVEALPEEAAECPVCGNPMMGLCGAVCRICGYKDDCE